MRFASPGTAPVGFREALFSGLAPDGRLYHPCETPDLAPRFASFDDATSFGRLAAAVTTGLLAPEVDAETARRICDRAFPFEPVLRRLDDRLALLELFHGPTCAFKDFGAQFLAAAMESFLEGERRRVRILVATSGDTGGAVARAFHARRGIDVVILYPSGRVSELQEKQLATLGGNVHALEVDGSFDDCQRLVKEAFRDPSLAGPLGLTSANSINIGRLLPQALYYIWAGTRRAALRTPAPPVFCVPSGNFGNLTAGVYAWRWGLPVSRFIAATNSNDVVPRFLEAGAFAPRPSQVTLSNAMDVGDPSNFERLSAVFGGDWRAMADTIAGSSVTDADTRQEMRRTWERYGVLVDPHTAVGLAAARRFLDRTAAPVIVLATAHPGKFSSIVRDATGEEPVLPEQLARCLAAAKQAEAIAARGGALAAYLRSTFG